MMMTTIQVILFLFLTCFFSIAGFNRIFNTRLMLFSTSPVRLVVEGQSLVLFQKNGTPVSLVKNLKYFPDYAGKSFGVSGIDGERKAIAICVSQGAVCIRRKIYFGSECF